MVPALPTRLDRYTIDSHYTHLVNTLRADGSPAAAADQAHALLLNQFRTAHPQAEVPPYLQHLGLDEEASHAPQTPPSPASRTADATPTGEASGNTPPNVDSGNPPETGESSGESHPGESCTADSAG